MREESEGRWERQTETEKERQVQLILLGGFGTQSQTKPLESRQIGGRCGWQLESEGSDGLFDLFTSQKPGQAALN